MCDQKSTEQFNDRFSRKRQRHTMGDCSQYGNKALLSCLGSASVEQSKEARNDAIITSSVKAADLF